MAKFSEFMQHSRIAKLITPDSDGTPVAGDELAGNKAEAAHVTADAAQPAQKHDDQGITQDEIVTQLVTTGSQPATFTRSTSTTADTPDDNLERNLERDSLDDKSEPYTDTDWEDALHSLPTHQRPLQRLLPMTARVGVLGLVAIAMWWTWPRSDDSNLWINDARAGDVPSFAVVNPANVEQAGVVARAASPTPDATHQAEQFTNIVIVTPTSPSAASNAATNGDNASNPASDSVGNNGESTQDTTLAEPIVLEASGLVTDATTGAIIIEIPEAVPVEALLPALEEETAVAVQAAQSEIILIPTATPTAQAVAVVDTSAIPKVEIVPAIGVKFTPTPAAPTPTTTPTEVPTATPPPIGPGRLWSTFTPLSLGKSDHFWIGSPFENFSVNRFASPSYQFGSTAGNRYRPHHGLDYSNPSGTPVQAAVEGTVVHAGPDDPDVLGPYPNFYGKAVVIRLDQQLPVAGGQLDVFVLYGHLSEVRAEVGQRVQPSDIVGLVGMTGIAIGPHLHVEARLGANTYDHTVNPYLWLQPEEGSGAVAVRVLTAKGRTWAGAKVSIARFDGGRAVWGRQIETYLDTENIGPDPLWGENGAMGDVPAGSYYLIATINGESIRTEFTVNAGETTFVEIRTEQ